MVHPLPLSTPELEELCKLHKTPLQIYDESSIRANAKYLFSSFTFHFPNFSQFFAVKALPNPAICQILIEEGCGLDCSSVGELYVAKKLGLPPHKILYTSNYTSKADLAQAMEMGVILNLDDVSLVDDLIQVCGKCPELICFRLNPGLGRTDSSTKSNVLGGPDAKFGIPPYQIVQAYKKAKENGSTRFGIHMMTGSCVMNNHYWTETASVLFDTIVQLKNTLGIECEFMNIGGGLGIPYRPEEKPLDLSMIASMLHGVFSSAAETHGISMPRLCMENGRYMTGPFGWLITRCQVIKKTYATYYGVDACMAHLMRPGMYEAYHHITIPIREDSDSDETCEYEEANVVGNLCENNDWFAKKRLLPKASVGDLFIIYDTGAHAHSMGFQYNAKTRAPEILLRSNGQAHVIRTRETIESLYANCIPLQ